ncbi:AraC-like DNA-binding protein [Epilithonimonas hungarica]|uniref:helix-turn-helix domain-containing protein n=1 Tax=Epilithonimonas hungarica TaxID=454006 RepID=UPI002788CEE6|nr:helix-turn-helix domain-containing protein [Epilithonimonas hungarica]MDP9956596.1 AraC-like DNA-binding protein [Epilithonimonas hungarica]
MMKPISFLFALFFNFFSAHKINTDSLRNLDYQSLKNKFYKYYDDDQTVQSNTIAHYYLLKAKKEKNQLQIGEGYILLHFNKDFPTALCYLDSLTKITKNITSNLYPARTFLMKGNLYYKYDNLKEALDNYILALKYAKEQNDEQQVEFANLNIAYLNSYIGKNIEAAKIFRHYLYSSDKTKDEYQHNQNRVSLINCYLEINKLDSANILIHEALESSLNNKYNINQYIYLSGVYNLKTSNYKDAIINLRKSLSYFSNVNGGIDNYVLYYLGKSYQGLNDKENTVKYFKQLDSNVQKENNTSFLELREVYIYLIDYYKEKGNKEKQLYFIDRFLIVDKKLDEQFKYLSVELSKKYDVPNLLKEKEDIISELRTRKLISSVVILILCPLLIFLAIALYISKKTERKHQRIAQDLIRSLNDNPANDLNSSMDLITENKSIVKKDNEPLSKVVPEDIAQSILVDLQRFEERKSYLKKGITLNSLAKNIKTNTAYLSEVINSHKEKNFSTYLNDLRIDYALVKLVKDKSFRSYKLSVIAEELGYNSEQAFYLAFKRKTGTTLSTYIREIEKTKAFSSYNNISS